MRLFALFLLTVLKFFPVNAVVWDGIDYNDETVSQLVTVITSTSPISSMPSTKFLYKAQKSLFKVPTLAKCKKIIVFDGVKKENKHLLKKYNQYKKNVKKLVKTDPYFANTQLVFCPEWGHLCGTIREAIKHVDTPYLFIHQHDLVLLKEFDLNGVIASMNANSAIKYVGLIQRPNSVDDWWFSPLKEGVEGISFVPLCRAAGWSDQTHIASLDYYSSFVLPQCHETFMEHILQPALKKAIEEEGFNKGQEVFGTHVYGHLLDGPYIHHADGQHNGRKQTAKRKKG